MHSSTKKRFSVIRHSTDDHSILLPAMIGLTTMMLIGAVVVAWSAGAPLASAVLSTGNVVLEDNVKSVQSLDGGVVKKIFVKEGDPVKQNEPLISFETETQATAIRSLETSLVLDGAQEARLESEIENRPSIDFPKLIHGIPSVGYARILRDQERQFETRMGAVQLHLREIQLETTGLQTMLETVGRQALEVQQRLRLQNVELSAAMQLAKRGTGSLKAQRDAETSLSILRGAAAEIDGRQADLRQQVTHNNVEAERIRLTFKEGDEADLQKFHNDVEEISQRLDQARLSIERALILSPTDGTVLNLNVHTVGGVVASGNLIMEVFPSAERILIETEIRPVDITDVVVGAAVKAREMNERFANSPVLEGYVTYVSPDRVVSHEGAESFFKARIEIRANNRSSPVMTNLRPGQPMEIMILKRPTTLLSYIFDPMFNSLTKAMRD